MNYTSHHCTRAKKEHVNLLLLQKINTEINKKKINNDSNNNNVSKRTKCLYLSTSVKKEDNKN